MSTCVGVGPAPDFEETPVRHTFPDGYPVSSACRSCGRDLTSDTLFDRHRVGDHQLDYPEHENGRRCATDEELDAKGLRPMTRDEKLATSRHARRADFDVELFWDPAAVEEMRQSFDERAQKAAA